MNSYQVSDDQLLMESDRFRAKLSPARSINYLLGINTKIRVKIKLLAIWINSNLHK
ncbi:MAG TPA: hypothetical protein VK203_05615 [Nostocaceae cyanobacterium]|nr:hypothetical protein [Nostocaceae cyanobacterium]